MKEDTLLDMVEYMTSKVGLVHQMPFTCDREGFAATFEKVNVIWPNENDLLLTQIKPKTKNQTKSFFFLSLFHFKFICRYFSAQFSLVSIYQLTC